METKIYIKIILLGLLVGLLPLVGFSQVDPDDQTTWDNFTYAGFDATFNMSITAVITVEGVESTDALDRVGAFIDGEMRGNAFLQEETDPNSPPATRFYLNFIVGSNGNDDGKDITFRIFDNSSGRVLPVTDTISFQALSIIGSLANPDTLNSIRIEITFTKDDVLCAADTFAFAKATVSGGKEPYFYQWENAQDPTMRVDGFLTDSVFNLGAGKYYLSVTDGNLFTVVDSVTINNINREIQAPEIIASPGEEVCEGTDMAFFAFTTETLEPNFYTWFDIFGDTLNPMSDVLTLPSVSNDFTVRAQTDVRNCKSTITDLAIRVNPRPDSSFSVSSRLAAPNQVIVFSVDNPEAGNTYLWDFGDGNTATGELVNYAYSTIGFFDVTLTVIAEAGCSSMNSLSLRIEEDFTATLIPTPVLCDDDTTGSIVPVIVNGTGPFEYEWSNGATTREIADLGPGVYFLTITDALGDSVVVSTSVLPTYDVLPAPGVIIDSNDPVCAGEDIILSVADSSFDNAKFLWYDAATDGQLNFVGERLTLFDVDAPSTYYVEQRVRACVSERALVVVEPTVPDARFTASRRVVELGEPITFDATVEVEGYVYEYDFDNGVTNNSGPKITYWYPQKGEYTVKLTVTTPDGCIDEKDIVVNVIKDDFFVLLDVDNVKCIDDTTGIITSQVFNGVPPFEYVWNTGETTPSISGLDPGIYSLTVIDANEDQFSVTTQLEAEVDEIPLPEIIIDRNGPVCSNDNILIVANTGITEAEYYWYDIGGQLDFVGNVLQIDNVQEDVELFVETRVDGCASLALTPVNVDVITPDASFTASRRTVELGEPITFEAVEVDPTWTYEYDFDNGATDNSGPFVTYTFPQIGTYQVSLKVTTPEGCMDIKSLEINVVEDDLTVLLDVQNVTCADDTTGIITTQVLNGDAPFTYLWSTGETTSSISGLSPGTYFLTVTDAGGDQVVASSQIEAKVDEIPLPDVIIDQNGPVCANDNILIVASTGLQDAQYYWYDAATDGQLDFVGSVLEIDDVSEDLELFVATVIDGCVSTGRTPVEVTVITPDASFSASSTLVELEESFTFVANDINDDNTYDWDFGNGETATGPEVTYTYPAIGPFTVTLKVTTPEGCMDVEELFVNVVMDKLTVLLDVKNAACLDDTSGVITTQVLFGDEPYKFAWSTGDTTSSIDGLAPGIYRLTVTDAGGDEVVAETQVEAAIDGIPAPTVVVDNNLPVCFGDDIVISASSGIIDADYYWFNSPENGELQFAGNVLNVPNAQKGNVLWVETRLDGCVSEERTKILYNVTNPPADFSISEQTVFLGTEQEFIVQDLQFYPEDEYSFEWDFGNGDTAEGDTVTYTYPAIGTYQVTLITNGPGLCDLTTVKEVEILENKNQLIILFDIEHTSCPDDASGIVNAQVLHGTPPYTYEWSNGETTSFIAGVLPGEYGLTVTDNDGRQGTGTAQVVSKVGDLPAPIVEINLGRQICFGEDITLMAGSNIVGADYYWYDAPEGGDLVLIGGVITLEDVRESRTLWVETRLDGCVSAERTEAQYTVFKANANFTAGVYRIYEDASVFFNAENTVQDAYNWNFGDGNTVRTGNFETVHTFGLPGLFTVSLETEFNGCRDATQVQILVDREDNETERLSVLFDVDRPLCEDDATGSIIVQVPNGEAPLRYEWSNGETGPVLRNVTAGTYTVVVRDGAGRVDSRSVIVEPIVSEVVAPTSIIYPDVICIGDGATIIIADNVQGANFIWYDAAIGGNVVNVGRSFDWENAQDSLELYVSTQIGACESSERSRIILKGKKINSNFLPSVFLSEVNGDIQFAAAEMNENYTYDWDFGNGDELLDAGPIVDYAYALAGEYQASLTVTDSLGCSSTSTLTMTIVNEELGLDFELVRPACPDDAGGVIVPIVLDGVAPFTYEWSTGETTSILTGLLPGIYVLTVTDNAGNIAIGTVELDSEVTNIPAPSVIIGNGTICKGDDLQLTATADLPGVEFFWYDGEVTDQLVFVGTVLERNNVDGPQSFLVETRFKGCTSDTRTLVEVAVEMPDVDFELPTEVVEEGTEISLEPTAIDASYTYGWDFGDGNTANETSTTHTYAATGKFNITLTANTLTGCIASTTKSIEVIAPAVLFATTDIINVECEEDATGSIAINGFNGEAPYTYLWDNGETTRRRTGLAPGSYGFTITSNDGFSYSDSATVISEAGNLLPPNVIPATDNEVCVGRSMLIYAYSDQEGVDFYWYDQAEGGDLMAVGSPFLMEDLAETKTLYAETRRGTCASSARTPFEIVVEDPNQGFAASPTTTIAGQNIQFTPNNLEVTNSYRWEFSDGSVSTDPITSKSFDTEGAYDVTLVTVSANGCVGFEEKKDYINIISASALTVVIAEQDETCEGDGTGSLTANVFNAVGSVEYLWSTGATTASITGLSSGAYDLTVTDSDGTVVTSSGEINFITPALEKPTISVGGASTLCQGEDVTLIGLVGQSVDDYFWFDESDNLLSVGTSFELTSIDANTTISLETRLNGCVSERASVDLEVIAPDAEFAPSATTISAGESVSFTPSVMSHASYAWNFGDGNTSSETSPSNTYAGTGTFTVSLTVTDVDGCSATVEKIDLVSTLPVNNLGVNVTTTDVMCEEDETGTITLTGIGGAAPYAYDWADGNTGATRTGLAAGIYSFTITDNSGASVSGNATIINMDNAIPTPQVIINGDQAVCMGAAPVLAATIDAFPTATYQWFTALDDENPIAEGITLILPKLEADTTVYVSATINGCPSDKIAIDIAPQEPDATFDVSPSSNLMEGDLVQFTPTTMTESSSYYWEFGDNGWSNSMAPYYFYNVPGNFDVMLTVTDQDGCESSMIREKFMVVERMDAPGFTTREDDVEFELRQEESEASVSDGTIQIKAFPNPFKDQLTVIFKAEELGNYNLNMMDMLGQTVWSSSIDAKDGIVVQEIPTTQIALENGMYLIQVTNGTRQAIIRVSHVE